MRKIKSILLTIIVLMVGTISYAQEITNPHAQKETRIRTGRVVWAEVVNKISPRELLPIIEQQKKFEVLVNQQKTVKTGDLLNPATLRVSMTVQGDRRIAPVDYVVQYKGKYYRCLAISTGTNFMDLYSDKIIMTNLRNVYFLYFAVPQVENVEEILYELIWTLDDKNTSYSSKRIEAKRCDNFTDLDYVLERADAYKESLAGYKMPPANIRVALPFNAGSEGKILTSKNFLVGEGTATIVTGGISGNALQLSGSYSTLNEKAFQYGSSSYGEQFALSLWVKPKIFKPGYIYAHGDLKSNGVFIKSTSTGIEVQLVADGNISTLIAPLKLNQWQLVTLSVYKKNIKLYVNERLVSELTATHNIKHVNDDAVLGRAKNLASGSSFEGWIDELRLYHNPLSQDEITQRVNKKE